MIFEYKVERVKSHENHEDYLNKLGEQSWEITDVFRYGDMVQYTFKRVVNKLLT